jgi:hypothetical protein
LSMILYTAAYVEWVGSADARRDAVKRGHCHDEMLAK